MSFIPMWLMNLTQTRSAKGSPLRAAAVASAAMVVAGFAWLVNLNGQVQAQQNQAYQAQSFQGGFPRPQTSYQQPQTYQSNYPQTAQAFASNQVGAVSGTAPGVPDARIASVPPVNSDAPASENAEGSGSSVRSLLQLFRDGGFMMYPIAVCSFAMMVFSFERFISLRSGRVIPRPFVKRLIEQLQQQQIDREEALELCERNPSSIANVLAAGVKKYGRPAVEVEQAILDAGERESNVLRRHMRLLNAISQVAPLLGLLGTVFGMIQSFSSIAGAQAMGRPELLAGGIGEALITTAAGLLVAIPAYVLYMFFLGHTDKLVMEIDSHSQKLVEVISAEGLQENDTSRSRSRTRKAA